MKLIPNKLFVSYAGCICIFVNHKLKFNTYGIHTSCITVCI
jgi:hypothetical protein